MKLLLFTLFLFFSFLMSSCSKSDEGSGAFDFSILDLNGDGISDVSYETLGDGYFEFIDRNFDSNVDVSNFYKKEGDTIVSSKQDDNFDGRLETKTIFKNGLPAVTAVDENCDGKANIIFVYKNGVLEWSEKLISPESKGTKGMVRKMEYEFGYPKLDAVVDFGGDEEEFHQRVLSYMDGQAYSGCL